MRPPASPAASPSQGKNPSYSPVELLFRKVCQVEWKCLQDLAEPLGVRYHLALHCSVPLIHNRFHREWRSRFGTPSSTSSWSTRTSPRTGTWTTSSSAPSTP